MNEKFKLMRECSEKMKDVCMECVKKEQLAIEDTIQAAYTMAFALSMALWDDLLMANNFAKGLLAQCTEALERKRREDEARS